MNTSERCANCPFQARVEDEVTRLHALREDREIGSQLSLVKAWHTLQKIQEQIQQDEQTSDRRTDTLAEIFDIARNGDLTSPEAQEALSEYLEVLGQLDGINAANRDLLETSIQDYQALSSLVPEMLALYDEAIASTEALGRFAANDCPGYDAERFWTSQKSCKTNAAISRKQRSGRSL